MPFNQNDIVLMMKKAAVDVIKAQKLLMEGIYGTVETINPLTIRISQQIVLVEAQLTLTRNVTDYTTQLTESELGTRTYTVNNALTEGEKVLILRREKQYLVIDRVVS
ncbi:MAG: hypothetical protein K0R54_2125 [Clostridiaceae bacterium]|jgi:fibronectin type 3 domain-containing protein|nr:hypothetical protein [Clostridiaceae bacterium]